MTEEAKGRPAACVQTALTAAYLDGELDGDAAARFELHLRGCPECSTALLEQRRLLCLLDAAFDETFEKKVALPRGFTRELKARAQNDLSGVRAPCERARALKICAALSVGAFALLGFAAFDAVVVPAMSVARAAGGVLGTAGHALADAGSGAGAVLRTVSGRLVADSEPLAFVQWGLFAAALALLLFLIAKYHRASD